MKGSIRDLGLPVRVENRLEYEGVRTIKKLIARTPFDLLQWPGFSLGSVKSVRIALERQGLALKDDPGIREVWQWVMTRDKERAREHLRRRRGTIRPTLASILYAALQDKTMTIAEMAEAAKKAGHKSKSKNFNTVVGLALLTHKKMFRRVSRGMYTAK